MDELKNTAKAAKQDVRIQKEEAQRARAERDRLRDELALADSRAVQLADEVERLLEEGAPGIPAFLRADRPTSEPSAPAAGYLVRLEAEAAELCDLVERMVNPSGPHDEFFHSPEEWIVEHIRGHGADIFLPLILAALELPADPWPGLTRADIERSFKGRAREARSLGLFTFDRSEPELLEKLIIAANREWFEAGKKARPRKKAAGLFDSLEDAA